MAKAKKAETDSAPTPTAKAVKAPGDELVTLTKGDESVAAHPNQVAAWVAQGWSVA